MRGPRESMHHGGPRAWAAVCARFDFLFGVNIGAARRRAAHKKAELAAAMHAHLPSLVAMQPFTPARSHRTPASSLSTRLTQRRRRATMADAVRRIMEDMVPELEDLQKRGLASAREVRQLAKRRVSGSSTRSKSRARRATTSCATCSSSSTSRRSSRAGASGSACRGAARATGTSASACTSSSTARRGGSRATSGCGCSGPTTASGRARRSGSAACTRRRSRCCRRARLWVKAAAWEMDGRHNAGAARRLLQRGLRVNAAERSLWLAYFRFELLFLLRVSERRELLDRRRRRRRRRGGGGGGGRRRRRRR